MAGPGWRIFHAAALAFGAALPLPLAAAPVELALVLAVDCSQSVDEGEFRLQMGGIAAALRQPAVAEAAEGSRDGIAMTLLQWSGAGGHVQAVPWTLLRNADAVAALAARIETTERLAPAGSTAVGDALAFSMRLIEKEMSDARRKVIDISGDGMNNQGEWPDSVRPRLLAAGITVNGLAIINEEPDLDRYYATRVIGGPGAFVLRAADFAAFAEAMARKLVREIAGIEVRSEGSAAASLPARGR